MGADTHTRGRASTGENRHSMKARTMTRRTNTRCSVVPSHTLTYTGSRAGAGAGRSGGRGQGAQPLDSGGMATHAVRPMGAVTPRQ